MRLREPGDGNAGRRLWLTGAGDGRWKSRMAQEGSISSHAGLIVVPTPPRLKRSLLVGASGLALAIGIAAAPPALALDECGIANTGDTVICTTAGNNFPNGISYLVIDLTIVVEDGVVIDTTGAAGEPGGIASSGVANIGNQVVKAGTEGGPGIIITTDGAFAEGIYAHSGTGSVAITFFGAISTAGYGARGIDAQGALGPVVVVADGDITTKGYNSAGIYTFGQGPVAVTLTGAISTAGDKSYGIRAYSLFIPSFGAEWV